MIKHARLESVVELFGDADTGSGQVRLDEISDYFGYADRSLALNVSILEAFGSLHSFELFSLLSKLRPMDVGFEDYGVLALSV